MRYVCPEINWLKYVKGFNPIKFLQNLGFIFLKKNCLEEGDNFCTLVTVKF